MTGVTGPVADVLVLMLVSVLAALAALYALLHLSIPGFFIFGIFVVVPGYVGWHRYQQASAPAVSVGSGGVWLAGTDRRAGQSIPWRNVDELVFFTVREKRATDYGVKRSRALGVRLRVPAPVSAEERALLDRVTTGLPGLKSQVDASVAVWEAMPYRQIGVLGRLERRALAKAVAGFAPWVRVTKGPVVTSVTPWVVGERDAPAPTPLQAFLKGPWS